MYPKFFSSGIDPNFIYLVGEEPNTTCGATYGAFEPLISICFSLINKFGFCSFYSESLKTLPPLISREDCLWMIPFPKSIYFFFGTVILRF